MTVKNTLQKVEHEVEKELGAFVEKERAAERELMNALDDAADRTRAAAKRAEREADAALSEDARKLREIAVRVEGGLASDLDNAAVELLHELDDVLGRARQRVRAALARRNAA
jgi:hypothetical protein